MPELPEVETTRRGLRDHLVGQKIRGLIVRRRDLRWPVPKDLAQQLVGKCVRALDRRGKYLLFRLDRGTLIVHLGMSGSLRLVDGRRPPGPHDHVDLLLRRGPRLRYCDPRRFGAWLWQPSQGHEHPLLRCLGPEPLSQAFDGDALYRALKRRKVAIKSAITDAHVVVGVGNIYACEALYRARIDPRCPAGRLSLRRCQGLAAAIKEVLQQAIEAGGTTLRDFVGGDGKPGYFAQQLEVYGREGLPCPRCKRQLRRIVQAQRSTFYCPGCQR